MHTKCSARCAFSQVEGVSLAIRFVGRTSPFHIGQKQTLASAVSVLDSPVSIAEEKRKASENSAFLALSPDQQWTRLSTFWERLRISAMAGAHETIAAEPEIRHQSLRHTALQSLVFRCHHISARSAGDAKPAGSAVDPGLHIFTES